ncbi:5-methyltetrahydropteroyltriglutamate--homocysteine methyltransferase-like [Hydractinia symbiolongicarpus]|uniref:5-methyltetrahydropteroyltriglutamate-- homocysteine methyltransferase-like n=1 Tax=Hydractinia symbiolongicarpus TaxID=13093 RepID=UPI00254C7AEE|nr:5-methyltetrahydropteroyltriglutamate--homocysteine methyltransferase-like [Hydractinia symbiolongicarpus]
MNVCEETKCGLRTTLIGSMPKPDYLKIPCWISNGKENPNYIANYNDVKKQFTSEQLQDQVEKAIRETINFQSSIGISVGTDGEMGRNQYVYSFCRNLNGFDFDNLKEKICRNNSWVGNLPQIISKLSLKPENERSDPQEEWRMAQNMSSIPIKYTIPGPLTIADTTANEFYEDEEELSSDLVNCINHAVLGLAKEGCKYIQIDEPVLVRYPEKALKFAIKSLQKCFDGVPDDVTKIVHMCCGYPVYLDQTDYQKADQDAYMKVADALDQIGLDMISLEDAHRRNSMELFKKFKNTTIILGVIDVVKSRVETVDEIKNHIKEVLDYIPLTRLVIAPDCGLIFLPQDILEKKLKNMVEAAKSFSIAD